MARSVRRRRAAEHGESGEFRFVGGLQPAGGASASARRCVETIHGSVARSSRSEFRRDARSTRTRDSSRCPRLLPGRRPPDSRRRPHNLSSGGHDRPERYRRHDLSDGAAHESRRLAALVWRAHARRHQRSRRSSTCWWSMRPCLAEWACRRRWSSSSSSDSISSNVAAATAASKLVTVKSFEDEPNLSLSAYDLMHYDANKATPVITLTSVLDSDTEDLDRRAGPACRRAD